MDVFNSDMTLVTECQPSEVLFQNRVLGRVGGLLEPPCQLQEVQLLAFTSGESRLDQFDDDPVRTQPFLPGQVLYAARDPGRQTDTLVNDLLGTHDVILAQDFGDQMRGSANHVDLMKR